MTLREKRLAAIQDAQSIISKAREGNRPLTDSERATVSAKQAEVESLNVKISRSEEDADLLAAFNRLDNGQGSLKASFVEGVSNVALSFKGVTDRVLRPGGGAGLNVKALIASGSQTVETAETGLLVVKERPTEHLLDAVPAKKVDPHFSFLRQTVRTVNAAPVARGALKPTSVFTLERKEARLKVVAHISEPIHEYDLKDVPALEQFVRDEMLAGLAEAILGQFLYGDGIGENLAGVTLVSGIQTQAWSTDRIETARYGLGKLESLGMTGGIFVFHPSDWLAIEVMRAAPGGAFLMQANGSPIDSVRRQLWGIPVALSTAVTPGTGYVLSTDAVMLFHDGEIAIAWNYVGDGFARNQIVCRTEARVEAGALRPSGIVQMDLTA